jgi:hypothetical protein
MVPGNGLRWYVPGEYILPSGLSSVDEIVADAVTDEPPMIARSSTIYRQPDFLIAEPS